TYAPFTGWAHKRPMGSSQEQPPHLPSQRGQDKGGLGAGPGDRSPPRELHGSGQGPYFYIGGTNGASIISSYCKSKGWQRIQDSRREDYKLKWCEVKCRDNYCSFREGEQLLYQIPNNKVLTTKIGLLSALREYSRVVSKTKMSPCAQAGVLKMEEFFPETYRLDIRDEREAFFTLSNENQIWICKPTASNQGKGIFLLRSQQEVAALQVKTQIIEDDPIYRKMPFRAPQARVMQRYIQNPLLLDGKKFDVRSYLLIACAMPYMVFFGHGYARLTLGLYDPHSSDLSGHLTNQFMQKKSPLYALLKEDSVWSMDRLNRYINDKFRKTEGLPRDWVFTTFTKRMQQIMAHCFQAVKSKLECKLGYFDLIGCDFLIDENFKVWLLEMNSNPALHTNCEALKEVVPGVVMETLGEARPSLLAQPWARHPTCSPNSEAHTQLSHLQRSCPALALAWPVHAWPQVFPVPRGPSPQARGEPGLGWVPAPSDHGVSRASHNPLSTPVPQPPAPSPVQVPGSGQPHPSLHTSLTPSQHPALTSPWLPPGHKGPPPGLLGQGLLQLILCLKCWWDLGSTEVCWEGNSIPRKAEAEEPLEGAVHRGVSGQGAKKSQPCLSSHSQPTHHTPAVPSSCCCGLDERVPRHKSRGTRLSPRAQGPGTLTSLPLV
uniref:Tubulin tyrosine ligase like 10 n=1 Tax=Suricata suricatta TaxID=37032 RepID=A0A673TY42_SURSU